MITLKQVDTSNWEDCIDLKVSEQQQDFIVENWYSLLQAKYESNCLGYTIFGVDFSNEMIKQSQKKCPRHY